jgi:DNA-binding NarL/FixJ family response regulator
MSAAPCRIYIVYRNALFAQGVRSLLAQESGVQIVGMERDMALAINAVRSLQPEVILIEEPIHSEIRWPFLEVASTSRIVTFSLHHAFATVYDHYRTGAADTEALVKAIRGARESERSQDSRFDPGGGMVSVADRITSDEGGHSDTVDPVSQPSASRVRKD